MTASSPNQFCVSLFFTGADDPQMRPQKLLADFRLTRTEKEILRALQRTGKPRKPQWIANRIGRPIDSYLRSLIRDLCKKGLVERKARAAYMLASGVSFDGFAA